MGEIQDKEDIAEFCGAAIGDGWIQSNEKSFFLAGDPNEDKEYYDSHMLPLINKILNLELKTKNFPYWKVYGISIHKKEVIKMLLKFGLPKGKKVDVAAVPDWIMKSNKRIMKAFIRGLFDTDGCIFFQKDYTKYSTEFTSKYHSKARIRISSISKKLMSQVFEIINKLNIKCIKRELKRGWSNNRNNHDVYIIEINRIEDIKNFFEGGISKNQKHITKYLVWKKFGFYPPKLKIEQRKQILKNKLDPNIFYKQE
jgi:intein/homing endonuclease